MLHFCTVSHVDIFRNRLARGLRKKKKKTLFHIYYSPLIPTPIPIKQKPRYLFQKLALFRIFFCGYLRFKDPITLNSIFRHSKYSKKQYCLNLKDFIFMIRIIIHYQNFLGLFIKNEAFETKITYKIWQSFTYRIYSRISLNSYIKIFQKLASEEKFFY